MKYTYILLFLIASFALWSCSEEDLDPKSIFGTTSPERNEFDTWILKNYTLPYNIDFKYRLEDKETLQEYNLVPADYNKSIALAKLIKYLWVDSYEELLGPEFIRTYTPRVIHLIGSPAYSNGSILLGTAEGGLKVTLYNVNNIDVENIDINQLNEYYFKTMHHEFAHILHQTKSYSTDFNLITPGKYTSSNWINISNDEALKMGFITGYGSSETQEDFVEIIAVYVTNDAAFWDAQMVKAGKEGAALIKAKLDIVKDYLETSWGINLDKLRNIVQRRSQDVSTLDLKTLN